MNAERVKGNWNEQKGKLKQKFASPEDEMPGKLQIKLGKTK